jgi:fructokinase
MANVVKLSEEELVFISGSNDLAYGIASVPSAISQNCYW